MKEEALLIGLSQLGGVFAGFIAIFTVFARKDGRLSPADSLRVRSIIYASFIVVLGSLLPLLLSSFGVSDPALWKISAAVFLVLAIPAPVDVARHQLALSRQDRRQVGTVHQVVSWGLSATVTLLLGSIALSHGGAGYYVLALMLTVAIATSNFVTIALQKLL